MIKEKNRSVEEELKILGEYFKEKLDQKIIETRMSELRGEKQTKKLFESFYLQIIFQNKISDTFE